MPVKKRWAKFTRENIEKIPKGKRGVYEIANSKKEVIYCGSSDSDLGVRGRLIDHLIHKKFRTAAYFRYEIAPLFTRAKDMEARHALKQRLKTGKKPIGIKRSPVARDVWGRRLI
jgi:hypothetical protein